MSAAGATRTNFTVAIPVNGAVVDVAAMLSRHNQRLYRQGRVYGVTVSSIPTVQGLTAPSGSTRVRYAGNSWGVRKAWGLAFTKWMESTQEERSNGIRAGRWNDFRIKLDASDNAASYVKSQYDAPVLADGEVDYTQFASDRAGIVAKELGIFGNTDANNYGILFEYDNLADTDKDTPPHSPSTMPYSDTMTALNDDQADTITEQGDDPPYDAVRLRNNFSAEFAWVGNPDTVNRSTGLLQVPCGLIEIYNATAETLYYQISVKSGNYKGVHAEAMA